MKILIVRTFPDIINVNTYNVQEIGLAKALITKGIGCGVVLYHGKEADVIEEYYFSENGKTYSFPIYWMRGISVFKNGFMPSVYKLIPEYDVVQVHEYDQIFSWMLYTRPQKPTLIYHGPYYHPYAKGYNLKCKVFDLLFLKWRKHAQVSALTKSELAADFLREKGFQDVEAVGVGVDRERFEIASGEYVRCLLERDDSKVRLLYVGKIEERRNVYFLIELLEKVRMKYQNVELVIVGSGEKEYTERFLNRIENLIEQKIVIYIPEASQKELSLIYKNTDMFVFTSNYEIFGMVLLEAMYFGLPVISSANGGASVLIRDGENGYMMPDFQIKEWQEKIEYLLGNAEVRLKMGECAHKRIEEHFLWEQLSDRFAEKYSSVVKKWEGR